VFGVVKGDFREYVVGCRRGGIPAYAGMTGGGIRREGGQEWGNAKAQGRYEKRAGDSRLRGNDGSIVGMTRRGVGRT